jgi:hypothetical protein
MSGPDERSLSDLFFEAGGEEAESLELGEGLLIESVLGGLRVNGKPLSDVPASTIEGVARRLREAADGRLVDPAQNPLIRTPVDLEDEGKD